MNERLKAWLDYQDRVVPGDEDAGAMIAALRAVVELHKPYAGKHGTACTAGGCDNWWPCPTIQAIEKEVLGE